MEKEIHLSKSSIATTTAPQILTIEQVNLQIKQILEGSFGVFWAQGEISNFKAHTSGHYYFSLKDSKAQISAVMFRGFNSKLKFKLHDGLEVIVRGRISVYEPRGSYQILCEFMEPVGAGALQKAYEQLKEKLKSEGLFESARKRALPEYPQKIAIVTSPTGAAIRDILNILKRRAPSLEVIVVPTLVQGEGASLQIVEALKNAQKIPGIDVVIIGRGGGSMEDLWAFNDEHLAREIAKCQVPVISAVGHEVDYTIADFVADLRAPTPSAAAELVARSRQEISDRLLQLSRVLKISLMQKFKMNQEILLRLQKQLVDPRKKLQDFWLRKDDLHNRLEQSMNRYLRLQNQKLEYLVLRQVHPRDVLNRYKEKLQILNKNSFHFLMQKMQFIRSQVDMQMKALGALSPLQVVDRGYSIVSKNNIVLKSSQQVSVGDEIQIQLAQGSLQAQVLKISEEKSKKEVNDGF